MAPTAEIFAEVDRLTGEPTCFQNETAWAKGPRYTVRGNWAMYTPTQFDTVVKIRAGQNIDAGYLSFVDVGAGRVRIDITLFDNFRFAPGPETLKIQGYASAPSGNPAPGQFASKWDGSELWEGGAVVLHGRRFSVEVDASAFYGIHLDVRKLVACP